jgi:hypothetical protein
MQARWQETVASLTEVQRNVVGDIVVSAGAITYLGPFTPTFRADLLAQWTGHLAELLLHFSRHDARLHPGGPCKDTHVCILQARSARRWWHP